MLGHYPQSFEFATIGGFAATRSSGQSSAGYGRFDALVVGLRVATPRGERPARLRPGQRRRPRPAPAVPRLRGRLRRDHRGDRAGPPAPRGEDLRGLALGVVRGRRRRDAHPGPGRAAADRAAALRRGRDRDQPGPPRRDRRRVGRRLPDDHRLRGHAGRGGRQAVRGDRAARGPGRYAGGRGRRPGVGARPLQRAVPPRLAARRRRAGGDAGDRDVLVQPGRALHRREGRAGVARSGEGDAGALPHLARLRDRLLALLHGGDQGVRRPAAAVAGRQVRRQRRDRGRRRDHHPPPRGRHRPQAVAGPRDRRARASRCCARSRPTSTRPACSTRGCSSRDADSLASRSWSTRPPAAARPPRPSSRSPTCCARPAPRSTSPTRPGRWPWARWSRPPSSAATSWSRWAATGCCRRWPGWSRPPAAPSGWSRPAAATTSPGCWGCRATRPRWPRCCWRARSARSTCWRCPSPAREPRIVAGSVYSGVDARAGELVDRAHRLPRKLQYPYAALRAARDLPARRYLVSVDGVEQEYAAANVVVANSAYYGSGMKIAPAATVVRRRPRRRGDRGRLQARADALAAQGLRRRPHRRCPRSPCSPAAASSSAPMPKRPVPVGGDGEPLGQLPGLADEPAVVEVQPGVLAVILAESQRRLRWSRLVAAPDLEPRTVRGTLSRRTRPAARWARRRSARGRARR